MTQGTNVTETIKFSTESFALEMLKQYYEDLRSMYNSIFNIFKLSSVGIALASGIVTFYKYGDSETLKGAEIAILSVTLIVVLAFFLISSIIIIGQGYRYRITQGMCHLIRSEYGCAKFVPESLLYKEYTQQNLNITCENENITESCDTNQDENKNETTKEGKNTEEIRCFITRYIEDNLKFIPTVFRNIYMFFVSCSLVTALSPILFSFSDKGINVFLIFLSLLSVITLLFIFNMSIKSHKFKTDKTLNNINSNLQDILKNKTGKSMPLQRRIQANLDKISHIILDVDGTLTGGEIIYGENEDEYKIFSVHDGLALTIAKHVGLTTVILSGRKSSSLEHRCRDLKIKDDNLGLGIEDKYSWLQEHMKKNNISSENVAYVGDDLNDYAPMQLASFRACPQNAVDEIKTIANYVATKKGGDGAVREIIETMLCSRGEWGNAIKELYSIPLSCSVSPSASVPLKNC